MKSLHVVAGLALCLSGSVMAEAPKTVEEKMQAADVNQDGKVDLKEYLEFSKKILKKPSKGKNTRVFKKVLDKNSDGFVTLEEWTAANKAFLQNKK